MSIRNGLLTPCAIPCETVRSLSERTRRQQKLLRFEFLEPRLCLSGRGAGPTPPTLFHTPDPDPDNDVAGRGAGPTPPTLFHTPLPGAPAIPSDAAGSPVILELEGGLVAFLTDEAAQGRDLNGDGDKRDHVLQSFDPVAGVVRNSGQQAIADSLIELDNGLIAFLTDELAQGRVLNGDKDKLDQVLQVFDAATGIVRNSRQQAVAGSILELEIGGVAFLTSEAAQRRVLNNDGDKLDNVLQSFDPVANIVRNSRQQAVAGSLVDLENGVVVFLTNELAQGRVLNGDGDKLDNVLQAFDATTGIVRNSGAQANAASIVDLDAGLVAFATSEAAQNRVLNGDDDKLDSVLHVFDTVLGTLHNTGQAV